MLPSIPKISSITPYIVRILGMNPGPYTLQGTNSYLIGYENSPCRIMIDTSDENKPDYVNNVRDYFNEHKHSRISDIICTHWHHDHVGSVEDILKLAESFKWPRPAVHKFPSLGHSDCLKNIAQPLDLDQTFDLTEQGLESSELRVIFSPGHTDDHCTLLLYPDGVLFCGDLILGHGSSVFDNLHLYMESLRRTLDLAPQLSLMLSAHGLEITDIVDKVQEYIDHRESRINKLESVLSRDKWQSEMELLCQVYEPHILQNESIVPGAIMNQYLVLDYLLNQQKVQNKEDPDANSSNKHLSFSKKLWKLS